MKSPVARLGLTILEVMIAVAILASALSMVGGVLYTMHQARAAIDEEIKVQAIAQVMTERLQGARWDDLGRDLADVPGRNAWSWHRRATKQVAYSDTMVVPPLQEQAAAETNDLVKLGILSEPSGVPGLQIYLEYYQMELVEKIAERLAATPSVDPRKVWTEAVGDPVRGTSPSDSNKDSKRIFLPEKPTEVNFATMDPAVVMRVLISWQSAVGGTRWHEVVIARRK
jgi:type II secretory pathway pseudopilin PulG